VDATLFANTDVPWPLRDGVVHVWRFACQQDPGALAEALDPDEREQARRFVASVHRDRYVVQHAMMRGLLAKYLDLPPHAIRFDRGEHGKPFVRGVQFNLSHTDDLALLAVSREIELGVDVERLATRLDPAELATIVLAPDEPAGDLRAFLRIWCRKEACLKATGIGLIDELPSVSVAADRTVVGGVPVCVHDLAISAAHAAALATIVPCAHIAPIELETARL
jgi:4'-phosphopantetheinyl transferase